MGATFVTGAIYDAFMNGPEHLIELFHGYTYSGHPLACAAGIATQEIYQREGLLTRARDLENTWADAVFALKGLPHVIDLRTMGLIAGIELEPRPDEPGKRAFEVFLKCFEKGVLIRVTGDIIALSPPLIIEPGQIDQLLTTVGEAIREVA
jgi:beta-alanine--pyruvate transaminase